MILTRTDRSALASTCPVDNSPLAEAFLAALAERFGIAAEAVYLDAHRCIRLPERRPERVFAAGKGEFVDEAVLSLYVHAGRSRPFSPAALEAQIFALFLDTLAEAGEAIAYPRCYLPQELNFYGFRQGAFARAPIPTGEASSSSRRVAVEYIDQLTLWHQLTAAMPALNRLPEVEASDARLVCFFDRGGAPRPLAIFADAPAGDTAERAADTLAEAIYAHMKPRDIRDAVTPASVRPMLVDRAALRGEERFAILREAGFGQAGAELARFFGE